MKGKIAIVGISALFPGAKTIEEFWKKLLDGEKMTSSPTEKEFRKNIEVFYHPDKNQEDKSYFLSGGFVRDFDFDSKGYTIDSAELDKLDAVYHWVLHTSRGALEHAGYGLKGETLRNCGLIVGNLSFPTKTSRAILNSLYSRIIEKAISKNDQLSLPSLELDGKDNFYNAFSGENLSAVTARALGLGGRHFAIDAACSSSLYAIKLASDYLNSRKADMMLAGAVSCADPLFVNMGFSYFQAFPEHGGVSIPLDKSSQGLTPSEGAGFVVLKRYDDAVRDKNEILAIVHSTGLSNDGKGKFLLSPNSKGQVECFRRTYQDSAISVKDLGFIECHATGTPLGDKTELESLKSYFDKNALPLLGAIKSNTGHMLTAAGMAGTVKLINSFAEKVIPGTAGVQVPLDVPDKISSTNVPWPKNKPLLGGINAFGFGGTNAHMVLGSAETAGLNQSAEIEPYINKRLAVTGMDVCFGQVNTIEEFREIIAEEKCIKQPLPLNRWNGIEAYINTLKDYGLEKAPEGAYISEIELDVLRYKIPPKEADRILAQQLLILKVADNAIKQSGLNPGQNIGVIIAMQPDPAIHKYTGRWDMSWQIPEALRGSMSPENISSIEKRAKDFLHKISADEQSVSVHTGFVGNLMACRISSLWDFTGPAFTVSSADEPFIKVLELAQMMISSNVCEGVVVGAVDLAGGVEHVFLRNKFAGDAGFPGEGAAAFVLQSEHLIDKSSVLAYLDEVKIEDNSQKNITLAIDSLTESINKRFPASRFPYLEFAASVIDVQYQNKFTKNLNPLQSGSISTIIGNTYAASAAASFAKAIVLLGNVEVDASPVLVASITEPSNSVALVSLSKGTVSRKDHSKVYKSGIIKKVMVGGPLLKEVFHDMELPLRSISSRNKEQITLEVNTLTSEEVSTGKSQTFTFEEACAGKLPVHKKDLDHVIWNEKDLLEFAGGSISKVFGEPYKVIDSYRRKVRLPLPPYLLVSRVTKLNAALNEYKPSTITTEYDIPYNAWYSVDGQIPWAVSVESGQCDLLLISYLGIDFENKGERIYRLLDCTLTFLDDLPKEGQTLRYDIKINSFVRNGDNLLFFFSYDCFVEDKMVLKMTNGCAGFFSDEELSLGQGVVKTKDELLKRSAIKKTKFIPVKTTAKRNFSRDELLYLTEGKPELCFGASYGNQWRNKSLKLPAGPLLMLDRVTSVDPQGGDWGLGLIIAEKDLKPDDWYFPCHFKADEVLAGSLQAEGGGQLLQFFMLFLGMHGMVKDARFQPVRGLSQKVRCRKQVTPKNKKLIYRMEIKEISLLPEPYVISDVEILTEGGLVAVHFENLGLCLKEKSRSHLLTAKQSAEAHPFLTEEQINNFALGSLVKTFGGDFSMFDDRVLSRQPNTDLQLISRVISFTGTRHNFTGKPSLISEYDVPFKPWYYNESSSPTVPYSVLMEIALQPCGVLTAYLGSAFIFPDKDVFFRNLDGEGSLMENIDLRGKTITNSVVLTSSTAYEGNIIQKFTFSMSCDGKEFYKGTAAFGFFPKESLVNQVGLDRGETIPAWYTTVPTLEKKSILLNSPVGQKLYTASEGKEFFRLSKPQLNFLDKLVYARNGGNYGKGYIHGLKKIDPSDWFYNCHFYQDPVMPGSLGVEAMLQSIQAFCLLEGLGDRFHNPYFSHPDSHQTLWKYRGQIIPDNRTMSLEIHITEILEQDGQILVTGEGSLWKEDIRIYELKNLAVLIKEFL